MALLLFVYGTLKPGEAYFATYCQPHVAATQPAQVQGRLYHLPMGYPALTDEAGWVTGTLLHLRDAAALVAMDAFEGYETARSPVENEYSRQSRPVWTLERQPLGIAWMYVMERQRVERYRGQWIPTGVWSQADWPSIRPPG
jgi:gamma-glutamylcyclotransferase (GGCT)/AIG2-like uncharacterized protein YtfP